MRNKKQNKKDKFMRFLENGKELTVDSFLRTDVSVFEMRRFKKPPISETVGNGLCAVPGA